VELVLRRKFRLARAQSNPGDTVSQNPTVSDTIDLQNSPVMDAR
jgi:hypothetical protein